MGCYIKNAVKTAPVWEKMSTFAKISAHNERFLLNKPKIDMETTKKRTREEVRAAFRAFMREREQEQLAAQMRHPHPSLVAEDA